MNPVIVFLLLIFLITIAVAWWLVRPLLRAGIAEDVSGARNVEALQVEARELTRDHGLGLLNDASLAEAKDELETRVLAEAHGGGMTSTMPSYKKTAILLGALLPILTLTSYLAIGTPQGLIPAMVRVNTQTDAPQNESQMDELFRVAEERLKAQPNDAKGWHLLARAKASIGQFDSAIAAYEKVVALTPNDADAWADYADAAAGKSEGKMAGKPLELVNRALAVDAKQPKALLLRGTHEIQINQLDAATKTFTLARSLVEPSTGFAQIADNALKDIAARGGANVANASTTTNAADPASVVTPAASSLLRATVTLGDSARAATASDDTMRNAAVFIIVRAEGAERGPPLAAKKLTLNDLTKPITITTSDAMIGGAGLAAGTQVTVSARLSLNGQPTPQTGDWQSAKLPIQLGGSAAALTLLIDQPVTTN